MADFSLPTLFVVPVGNTLPTTGSTDALTAGQFGLFLNTYAVANAGNIAAAPYFYAAQGRGNTYLQGSKRSTKISNASKTDWYSSTGSNFVATTATGTITGGTTLTLTASNANVVVGQVVSGAGIPANTTVVAVSGAVVTLSQAATNAAGIAVSFAGGEIIQLSAFNVTAGEDVSLTIRAFSSYINTNYFNGLTRTVTVKAPCLACGGDPCASVDPSAFVDKLIAALTVSAPGINPDNATLNTFFLFTKVGTGNNATLVITAKPLTVYAQPCDVSADIFEYDRLTFRAFIYAGAATTADFNVYDNCNIVATVTYNQRSFYGQGTADQVAQLERNYYSYQAGYLKDLYRMGGYNQNFESYVTPGTLYDLFYIKVAPVAGEPKWGDFIPMDSLIIIAAPQSLSAGINTVLTAALGAPTNYSGSNPPTSVSPITIP